MPHLTLDQIKAADDVKTVEVEIPEWNGHVTVKGMTGRLRSNLEQKVNSNAPHGDVKMMVVIACTLNADGNPMFSNDDKKWLVEKAAGPIEKIFEAACKLSGITDQAVDEAEGN